MFEKIKSISHIPYYVEGKLLIMSLSKLSKYECEKEPDQVLADVVKLAEDLYQAENGGGNEL